MSKCIKCGSYAFNLYKEDIDQGGLCDVHYWQYRAHRAEALAEQPAQQEPFTHYRHYDNGLQDWADEKTIPLYTAPPAQRTWVGLTAEEIDTIYREIPPPVEHWKLSRAIEAKLRSKNEDRN